MSNDAQIAYCGLFCGDCIIRRDQIGKRAGELLQTIQTPKFQKLAIGLPVILPDPFKALSKIDDCRNVLSAMSQLDCTRPCKMGGGSAECKIKVCCQQKNLTGCWECDAFEDCETLAWLEPVNVDAHLKNLRILMSKGVDVFLAGEKFW
jgi:hypothetical protein